MLKVCKYCGLIHKRNYICTHKPNRTYKNKCADTDNFRSTKAWQQKRTEIKERDLYICQICKRNLYNTVTPAYNAKQIQVHHINKLSTAYDKRLDNDNLISLCTYHHKMADDGLISINELLDIVKLQEFTGEIKLEPPYLMTDFLTDSQHGTAPICTHKHP